MEIARALPPERYVKALNHGKKPEFQALIKSTVLDIQGWMQDKRLNRKVKPVAWCSGGKDSTAMMIVMRMAGIEFTPQSIDNGGDLPQHYSFMPELIDWFGMQKQWITYRSDERMIDNRYKLKQWGNVNGVYKKSGDPVDFFDLGALESVHTDATGNRFAFSYSGLDSVPYFLAIRAGEGMERAFEISTEGRFQHRKYPGGTPADAFRILPLGNWKDLDVWALLVQEQAPVSPVYSMHQLPQKAGRGAFPRTLHYCDHKILSATYFKWLAHYCPGLLSEMIEMFPEIEARFAKPKVVKPAVAAATSNV